MSAAAGDPNGPSAWFAPDWADALARAGLTGYEAVMTFAAGETLDKPGLGRRQRTRIELEDDTGRMSTAYLKRYATNEPARDEWRALKAVRDAGVPTMAPLAFGEGPAGGFVLVSAVPGDALSRRILPIIAAHGRDDDAMRSLAESLGELVGCLHAAGLVHRDLYADHVFVDESVRPLTFTLIDLARVFAPARRLGRWRVKDLSQLIGSLPGPWLDIWQPVLQSAYERRLGRRIGIMTAMVLSIRTRGVRRRRAAIEHEHGGAA